MEKIMDALLKNEINQLYVLGGDGTHQGIKVIFDEVMKRKLKITVIGIPKTIDNDIPIIDKSFGFETSLEESIKAIESASVEAHCVEEGVGLVRLMGRHAGFIAMEAVNASNMAHICLVPEFPCQLRGPNGILEYVIKRLKVRNNCVIVAAEGAADAIKDLQVENEGMDASGNVKLADIGQVLQKEILSYGKEKGMNITLKYINPTYMIRTVPANTFDKLFCTQLAQGAVHGGMAGYTGFSIGHVNNKLCMIPLKDLCGMKSRRIAETDRRWQRLKAQTGQPDFLNDSLKKEIVIRGIH